jgi:hypothetical protein
MLFDLRLYGPVTAADDLNTVLFIEIQQPAQGGLGV